MTQTQTQNQAQIQELVFEEYRKYVDEIKSVLREWGFNDVGDSVYDIAITVTSLASISSKKYVMFYPSDILYASVHIEDNLLGSSIDVEIILRNGIRIRGFLGKNGGDVDVETPRCVNNEA